MGSSSAACLRLLSDLKAITQEPPEGCSASPTSEENLFVWSATVFGPDETIWEGGIFSLRCGTCRTSGLKRYCKFSGGVTRWGQEENEAFPWALQDHFQ